MIRPRARLALAFGVVSALMLLAPAWKGVIAVAVALDCALLAAAVVDALLAARPGDVEVERICADRLSLGAENLVRLRVRSFSPRPARLEVRDDPPPEVRDAPARWLEVAVTGRGEAEARYHLRPRRRGDYAFGDAWLRSYGPLGLVRLERKVPAARAIRVYPNLIGIERWKLGLRRQRLGEMGLHVIRKRGTGTEFEKLKPYTVGDEFRHLDWKATARRRAPVSRVFETERSQTVMVLIDAGRQMAPWVEGLSRLDYAVNAALMLAYVASTRDDKVGLAVFADELQEYLEPRKGAAQYRRFMEHLYRVEAEAVFTDFIASFRAVATKQKKRSLVVIFTDITDAESLRELARALSLLRPAHLPLVVALRDPSFAEVARAAPAAADGVFEKVVARELLEDRSRAVRELTRGGAHVLDVLPQDFSASVVSKYLELKARGLL
ncbi:MAG TPA: DUF58 domain-containing protein [Planctomycetota bacterium]|nr:DUF58 domain-containing protein [Planctomycetota bacterium]